MALVVSPAVADIADAAAKLRADDAVICDGDRLLGDIETLLDTLNAVHAVIARRVADAIEIDATAQLAGRSMKSWLVEDLRLPSGEAGRLVKLGRYLPDAAPTANAAFQNGQISAAHASAIMTALATLPADLRPTVEPHLFERATSAPPVEIAGFADELLDALGQDKDSDARRERRHATRGLDLARSMGGMWSVSGTLSAEVGTKLHAALAAAGITGSVETRDNRSPRQRRHDALGVVADGYLAADTPAMTGAPRSVIVTMDLDTLTAQLAQRAGTLPDGMLVGPQTARRLACDAALIPVVLGGRSEILDIGVADHDFTVAIRRAAYLRDKGRCAFPRCRNRIAELHHIHFRRHGGPTSLDNAAWLCNFHHYLAHDGGWRLQRTGDGHYQWTSPMGLTYTRRLDDP